MSLERGTDRRVLAAVALGNHPADALFVNGRVVDVHTGTVRSADVAVVGDRIAAVTEPGRFAGDAAEVVDLGSAFVVPGLIDTHLHLVSCHLSPPELARQLLARGTAAVSACFYESGIVGGRAGLDWMRTGADRTDLAFLLSPFLACLRGVGRFGGTGRISDDEFLELVSDPDAVEVREWNVHLEMLPDPAAAEMIMRARREGLVIAGHLQGMTGSELQASVAVGASSDHEAVTAEEALERIALGVKVQIREGSAARNFDALITAITEQGANPRNFMFCTDGQEAHHTDKRGHIDGLVARAVSAGVPAVDAIRMGSLNAAEYLRIDQHLGSLTPGRRAHLNIVSDLQAFSVDRVYVGGRLVARDGCGNAAEEMPPPPASARGSMRVAKTLGPDDMIPRLRVDGSTASVRVIGVESGVLTTTEHKIEVRVDTDGHILLPDSEGDISFMAVVDRHDASGRIGHGLIRGLGLRTGAVACSNSPALMNLMAVGREASDMAMAASRVVELGGGIAVVRDGRVLAEVALALFGVLSDRPAEEVVAGLTAVDDAIHRQLGSDFDGLLSTAGFAMMPVSIPGLKLCDRGLVLVARNGARSVSLQWEEP